MLYLRDLSCILTIISTCLDSKSMPLQESMESEQDEQCILMAVHIMDLLEWMRCNSGEGHLKVSQEATAQ